jgi:hypothetical protein
MKYFRGRDEVGGVYTLPAGKIANVLHGEDFHVIEMDNGETYQIDLDVLDELEESSAEIIPALPGWRLFHLRRADASQGHEGVGVELEELPLVAWRLLAGGRLQPLTPNEAWFRWASDKKHDNSEFAGRLAVASPEGKFFVVGGLDCEGSSFAAETDFNEWIRDHLTEITEDIETKRRKAQTKRKAQAAERLEAEAAARAKEAEVFE